jgi:ubiquinone/menaquinone biosynthesis C-methylase UbiE
MLARVLEPEVMDTAEEARDYDAMDHAEVNRAFCDDLLAFAGGALDADVLDVGTGTARIPIALSALAEAQRARVVGIDLADQMLAVGRENVARAGLASRVSLERRDAKALPYADGAFGAVISNSIVHHIPEPGQVLSEMWRVTAPGGVLFVRDLLRPESEAEVERLVALHGGRPPEDAALAASFERQLALFRASLHAALTTGEVAALAAPLRIAPDAIRVTSNRHWTLAARRPGAP